MNSRSRIIRGGRRRKFTEAVIPDDPRRAGRPESTGVSRSIVRPIAFEQLESASGEERVVTLQLDRMRRPAYIDPRGREVFEPGRRLPAAGSECVEFTVGDATEM